VGSDIQAGTYHTDAGGQCYWARLSRLDGSGAGIITNDNATGSITVEIKPTDTGFESEGCGTWALVSQNPPTSQPLTQFGDGTYAVNTDIAPGTYRTAGGDGCYWARLADLGGAKLISNDNASGPVVVTIQPTDGGFKSSHCGTWSKVADPVLGAQGGATSFGDGTWRVGVDVQPGTYQSLGQDNCYYELLSGFGGPDDVIGNDLPNGPATITLDSSILGVKSSGCGTWTKIG
jgi:hypothetical protein